MVVSALPKGHSGRPAFFRGVNSLPGAGHGQKEIFAQTIRGVSDIIEGFDASRMSRKPTSAPKLHVLYQVSGEAPARNPLGIHCLCRRQDELPSHPSCTRKHSYQDAQRSKPYSAGISTGRMLANYLNLGSSLAVLTCCLEPGGPSKNLTNSLSEMVPLPSWLGFRV